MARRRCYEQHPVLKAFECFREPGHEGAHCAEEPDGAGGVAWAREREPIDHQALDTAARAVLAWHTETFGPPAFGDQPIRDLAALLAGEPEPGRCRPSLTVTKETP